MFQWLNSKTFQQTLQLFNGTRDKGWLAKNVVATDRIFPSFIKGHHMYRNLCTPTLNKKLYGKMEPSYHVDKYAVSG